MQRFEVDCNVRRHANSWERILNLLDDFVDFLAKQWSESPDSLHPLDIPDIERMIAPVGVPTGCTYRPWHWYPITSHACWKAWKTGGQGTCSLELQRSARDSTWWCASLEEASQHYSWTRSPHGTFVSLSAELRVAMKASNVQVAASVCHRILDWGGVARRADNASRHWINDQESAGSLIRALGCAVSHLQPQAARLSRFDFNGIDLPMNSATTKIFAAADSSNATLIFDGRVGAALCLLVRRFLETRPSPMLVPLELLFYWGPHATKQALRNPSTPQFSFRDINQVTSLARAQASQRANIVAQRLHAKTGVAPDNLERALFMVGYSVNA
ncbi:hypothetical protein [Malikia spinosa]|uniref:hypothetical protein n=1 Tax=Malikia spinosa TaxID=86180 RepID=UPI0011AFEE67|nr:hypothetical protein [Malikia spinosa]